MSAVSEGLLILISLAMLLAAGGLLLWQWATKRQTQRETDTYLAAQIQAGTAREEPTIEARRPQPPIAAGSPAVEGGLTDPWAESVPVERAKRFSMPQPPGWLLGAVTSRILILALLAIAVIGALAFMYGGGIAAIAAVVATSALAAFGLWLRVEKARKVLIGQLPGFIDNMVRLITIGNSTHAAFQLSIGSTKEPLRHYLEKASSLTRAGMDLDQALRQMASSARVEELHLLASILGLGVRYGGRADLLLERVAHFMRDHEQAEEELAALSAETRLSAWILGLLPVVVGGFIIVSNPGYLSRMIADPTGRTMLMIGFGLQTLGVVLLYRLARLK